MRKLLWVLAICVMLSGTAVADPISLPTSWSCAGFTATTCGFAADAVSAWPLTTFDPYADPSTYPADYWAAAAMFQVTGNVLEVYLANISQRPEDNPNYLLTGVFFDVGDGTDDDANLVSFTKVSATLASGATILNPGECDAVAGPPKGDNAAECGSTTDVGAEWAYKQLGSPYINHFPGLPGPTYGISSSGLGYFAPTDVFPNTTGELDNPADPNGTNFGITPVVGLSGKATTNLTGEPIIKSGATWGGVVFKFTFTGTLDVSKINNVLFQYGTNTAEPFTWPNCVVPDTSGAINGPAGLPHDECSEIVCEDCGGNEVPEPASLILVGSGFIGLAGFLRRRLT